MSVEERTKNFLASLATHSSMESPLPAFNVSYYRLVFIRRVAETLIIAFLVLGGQQFLIQQTFLSALWPITGVALAAVFLRGNAMLFGIFLGSLTGYLHFKLPFIASFSLSFLFTLYIFLIRFICLKLVGPIAPLATLTVFSKFCIILSLLSAFHISLLLKILTYTFAFKPTYFNWLIGCFGQINGILCLTPLCLIFDPFVPQQYFRLRQWRWWGCAALIICVHLIYLLLNPASLIFSLLSLLVLNTYAITFGQIPTGITLLGLSVLQISLLVITPQSLIATSSNSTLLTLIIFTLTAFCSLAVATFYSRSPR